MNRIRTHLLSALATAVLGASSLAQTPENPPPWWGVHDDVTVSLYWDFSGPAPLVPIEVAVPPWYNNPVVVTQAVPTGPISFVSSLNGHTDVLALVGNGTSRSAQLAVTIDNDPHYDWVKVFWVEFDEFEGAGASVEETLQKELLKYERSSVTTKSTPLGNGWNRVTVNAKLVPQPDDEGLNFSLFTSALGSAAIDNLFVNSKCIKVDDSDKAGDAMGERDGAAVDLTNLTGAQCLAAAVTTGPGPAFQRSYWISGLGSGPGASHQVFRLNQSFSVVSVTTLPATSSTALNGASDLAVETVIGPGGTIQTQFVWAIVDLRASAVGTVRLLKIDGNGAIVGTIDLVGMPPLPPQRFGLAFNPSGNHGSGTFLVTAPVTGAPTGAAFEFDRQGAVLDAHTNLPLGVVGAGYDSVFGNYYFFSNQPIATPSGPVQINGTEVSGYDFAPTGVSFFGDTQIGGQAAGIDVYRRATGEFRAACVVQVAVPQPHSVLYELKGPFRWGDSLHGTVGMRGLPFEGSNNFQITLSGVPNANFAIIYVGFGQRSTPLPLSLFGVDECYALINLDMNGVLQPPVAPGEFAFTMPLLPPGSGFSYVPLFFQWLVFDPSLPAALATSPAGKTVIY